MRVQPVHIWDQKRVLSVLLYHAIISYGRVSQ